MAWLRIRIALLLSISLAACANPYAARLRKLYERPIEVPEGVTDFTCRIGFGYDPHNLRVTVVGPNAVNAGILVGDHILSIDGVPVEAGSETVAALHERRGGEGVVIRVERSGRPVDLSATCGNFGDYIRAVAGARSAGARGDWDRCIAASFDMERLQGPTAAAAYLRVGCSEAKRLSSRRRPNINDAELLYEALRRDIVEASYSQIAFESKRGDVIRSISWLRSNGFTSFASDLENQIKRVATRVSGEEGPPPEAVAILTGTCFAISPDGLVVTAHHVVSGASEIVVRFASGALLNAKIVVSAEANDLAVLQVDGEVPGYLSIASPRSVTTGEPVFTLGFPVQDILGTEAKFTDGTVSALSGAGGEATVLQISVPIQPGNSGGPLLRFNGTVIGVITSTASFLPFVRASGALPQNINWAVKSDYLLPLIDLPPMLPPAKSRNAAIARATNAVCEVEARRP